MRNYTSEELLRAKTALPPVVQTYLDSKEFQRAIFNTGTWYKLNLAEIDTLTRLVTATITGIERRDAFVDNLATELPNVAINTRAALFIEVDRWIFQKLKTLVAESGRTE